MAGKLSAMAHITVPDESTVTTFAVTTAQSVFSVPWTCFDKTDIQVLVNGVLLAQTGFTFVGNPGAEGGFDGATITLNTAVSNTTVTIYRDIIVQRTDDFGAGPVSSRDRNTALDRLTAMIQDTKRIAKGVPPEVPLLPDAVQTVDNIVALRAKTWPSGRPTQAQVISNWTTGDGGGLFRWDAASTATDNGGTIIKETAVTTGRWLRQIADRINVTWFGAIGDGTTNSNTAFDAAAVVAMATGRPFYMPAGSYLKTTTTTFSVASKPSDESEISYSIIGDGSGVTEILWNGASGFAPFLLQGGTGAGVHHEATIKGFKVNSVVGLVGVGLSIDNLAKAQFEDFFTLEMGVGVYASDTLSCSFRSCSFIFGNVGVEATRTNFSHPNAISFYSCIFGNNRQWGMTIYGGSNINLFGGSVEGNGIAGTGDRGGVILLGNPTQEGGCAFAAYGTYWEAQNGLADLFVDPGAESFTIKIDGCSFNRISSAFFTTNHILVSQAAGEGTVNLVVDGTAFKSFNDYVPSSARKVIAASSLASVNIQAPLTRNIFENAVEMPDVLDTQPLATVTFDGTNGTVFRANPTGLTVTRLSAGEYRFNLPITTNTTQKFVQLLSDTAVIDITKWAETANTVTIRCFNAAGTATDLSTAACAQIFNG